MSSVGVQLVVRGMVQGVGFRFWCCRVARSLGLTGWVRNNPDGSVSVMAEGERSLVEEFIKEVKVGPSLARVADVKVTWAGYTGQFEGFNISM